MVAQDIMIDIETISTASNAVICSLAAIKFDRFGKTPILEDMNQIYIRVSIESCEVLGMHKDQGTIDWWKTQSADIRYEAMENPVDRVDIKTALQKLSGWIGNSRNTKIWSHGDDFDCVILANAYKTCSQRVPWEFWNTRDTRTLYDIASVRVVEQHPDKKHHPLHDCYNQIYAVHESLTKLSS